MGQARHEKSVLVIEDDLVLRACLAELLQAKGYRVTVARNGQHGLDILQSMTLPDLILLDLMMPIKDGTAFRLEQCKDARLKAIPTVVMSAGTHVHKSGRLFAECAYISKPMDIDRLLRAVERKCE